VITIVALREYSGRCVDWCAVSSAMHRAKRLWNPG